MFKIFRSNKAQIYLFDNCLKKVFRRHDGLEITPFGQELI